MSSLVLAKILQKIPKDRFSAQQKGFNKLEKTNAGFTLIEILVVVIMVGVLAAIAAPSWLNFVNRQRLNKANDAVLSAIQEAQKEAQKNKLSYSISFRVENQIPQIIIHPDSEAVSSISNNDKRWQILGQNLGIKPGQLRLLTNLTSQNTADDFVNANPNYLNTPQTITFDYMGTLTNANFGTATPPSTEPPGIKVVVSTGTVRRCVILKNLLGGTLTQKDNMCN